MAMFRRLIRESAALIDAAETAEQAGLDAAPFTVAAQLTGAAAVAAADGHERAVELNRLGAASILDAHRDDRVHADDVFSAGLNYAAAAELSREHEQQQRYRPGLTDGENPRPDRLIDTLIEAAQIENDRSIDRVTAARQVAEIDALHTRYRDLRGARDHALVEIRHYFNDGTPPSSRDEIRYTLEQVARLIALDGEIRLLSTG